VETVPIQLPDGTVTPVRLFPAEASRTHPVTPDIARPVIVVMPGLGIPGGYFDPLAHALAARGFDVAVGEMRGQGDSRPRPTKSSTFGYHDLVAVDIPAIVSTALERFTESTPYLLGHSMGGQLGALYAARARGRLGGLILVAAGTPYFRNYSAARVPGMLAATTAMSSVAAVAGYWPGGRFDVGGFGPQSRVLLADWARLARTGRFDPAGADVDYEQRLARVTLPVLSIAIAGDERSPQAATEHLAGKLTAAELTRWTQPEPLGHNGWIRNPESTVDRIEKWLRDR
jgi:predicted alpha/beta hydrolase